MPNLLGEVGVDYNGRFTSDLEGLWDSGDSTLRFSEGRGSVPIFSRKDKRRGAIIFYFFGGHKCSLLGCNEFGRLCDGIFVGKAGETHL